MPRRLSIATKFFLTYFVITGTALSFAGVAGYLQFKRYAFEEVDQSLANQARLAAEMFRPALEAPVPDREAIAAEGDRIGRDLDARLTVVLPGGEVVADSGVGAAGVPSMENHSDHPEVRTARSGKTGFSTRRSITVGEEQRYCAVPILSGTNVVGVARISIPATQLNRRLDRVRAITWGTGFVAFLLMLAGTAIRARHVTGPLDEIREAAGRFTSGDLSRRIHVRTGDELEEVADALNHAGLHLAQTIRQLDGEKARLATLLENLAEGVLVIGGDRTVRIMNATAAAILSTTTPPGEGRPYGEVLRHPDLLRFISSWRRGEKAPPREILIPSRTGDRSVRVTATTVQYRGNQEPDLLLTLQDITEERRLSKIKSDFVSNASHELRTPLTSVRGYLEALQDAAREGTPPDPSFLEIAHANALRMEQLIEDLLELSRAESGRAPVEKEEIRLPVLLDRIASLHRPAADRSGKSVVADGEETVFRGDPRKLTLALSNLVDNAIKYGKEGGTVRVSGRKEGDAILIEVEDDGPGIPPEHLPRIFERFYRVDKGRSRELGGTGLGLSIAKHIVESHGGTIRAESRLGVGTRFLVRIPAEETAPQS